MTFRGVNAGLKGVGKVYLQAVLDCYSRHAWGRPYTSKLPLTAVQVLNNDVLPFFDHHGIRVRTVLSDNGREFCGRPATPQPRPIPYRWHEQRRGTARSAVGAAVFRLACVEARFLPGKGED